MAEPRRLTDLESAISEAAVFPDGPYVIALSGGADSAALAASVPAGSQARCLHVHHGLRASDDLARAAGEIAGALGLELETVEVTVRPGPSPEAMAREARYSAFAEVDVSDRLLLAHTRNDQAETVLMNLVRGSGIRGIAGMPYHRQPNIFRPFLDVTRDITREYAALRALPFFEDPTNLDRSIRRNRIRLDLTPRLEELNPNLVEALAGLAGTARADSDYLDLLASAVTVKEEPPGSVSIPIGELVILGQPLRSRVVAAAVGRLRPDPGLSRAELGRVEEVIFDRVAAAELEGSVKVNRRGPLLRLAVD